MSNGYGGGSGTSECFVVEARTVLPEPQAVGDQIFSREWRRVRFDKHPHVGVPVRKWYLEPLAQYNDLLDFEAAIALALWYQAAAHNQQPRSVGLEMRLVKVKLTYTYDIAELGVGEPISSLEMKRAAKFSTREAPQAAVAVDPHAGSTTS